MYTAIPVVAGIIALEGQVLLTKRHSKFPEIDGMWEFPGGKVEEGETLQQALRREIKEELALTCTVPERPVHARMNYLSFGGAMIVYYRLVVQEGSIERLDKKLRGIEHEFVPPRAIRSYNVLPGTLEALAYVNL
jgi:mutator protein MutT